MTSINTVYMRVHKDTGYYYIGSTDLGVIKRHSVDVTHARQGKKLGDGCNITSFIWGILLRGGDPYEEFDFINLGEYETREKALKVEIQTIIKYSKGRGNRDRKLMLNVRTFCPIVVPIFTKKKNRLSGYEVKGGIHNVYMSFRNTTMYSLDDLLKFANEYADTGKIPENYKQSNRGVKREYIPITNMLYIS